MIPLACVIFNLFIRCSIKSENLDVETDIVHESISEMFDNMFNIYSMDTINKELSKLEKDQEKSVDAYKDTFAYVNKIRLIMNISVIVIFTSIIVYSYKLYLKQHMPLSDFINIAITGVFFIGKVGAFSGELPDFIFNLGIYNRISHYLSGITSEKMEKDIDVKKGHIKYDNVNIKYGDKSIIKNFNLEILPGKTVGILGKIGSGKSSLIKALLLFIPISSGNIYIDNQNIKNIKPSSLRSQVIYVPQNPIPFNRSLYDNISYGNDTITKKDVDDIFNKYSLHSFFGDTKLDDNVGRKGSKLSGGQRQMVSLLHILLSNSSKRIVILDEPTSSLDINTSNIIIQIIKEVTKNRTVIIVTHDNNLKSLMHTIVHL